MRFSQFQENGVSCFVMGESREAETCFRGQSDNFALLQRFSHPLDVSLIDGFSGTQKNFAHVCSNNERFKNRELSDFDLDVPCNYATLFASCEA
jgi:molybdopterin-guanine dinucleotide biosynthesis protein